MNHVNTAGSENITFQVILYETWNSIKCQYQDVFLDDPFLDFGASATVGIENADGTIGLEYLE
ncbi:MAG: hypothetical protein GWN00_06315, partial [Aliifodinibius sp.]|nr:hypothetical protein [Fodinibius sp.]NIY24433.1 hypothetical protein [Fodinibius sp.]